MKKSTPIPEGIEVLNISLFHPFEGYEGISEGITGTGSKYTSELMLAESKTDADPLRVSEEVSVVVGRGGFVVVALVTRLTVVETVVVVSFSVGRGGFDVVALVTRLTVVVVREDVSLSVGRGGLVVVALVTRLTVVTVVAVVSAVV